MLDGQKHEHNMYWQYYRSTLYCQSLKIIKHIFHLYTYVNYSFYHWWNALQLVQSFSKEFTNNTIHKTYNTNVLQKSISKPCHSANKQNIELPRIPCLNLGIKMIDIFDIDNNKFLMECKKRNWSLLHRSMMRIIEIITVSSCQ